MGQSKRYHLSCLGEGASRSFSGDLQKIKSRSSGKIHTQDKATSFKTHKLPPGAVILHTFSTAVHLYSQLRNARWQRLVIFFFVHLFLRVHPLHPPSEPSGRKATSPLIRQEFSLLNRYTISAEEDRASGIRMLMYTRRVKAANEIEMHETTDGRPTAPGSLKAARTPPR